MSHGRLRPFVLMIAGEGMTCPSEVKRTGNASCSSQGPAGRVAFREKENNATREEEGECAHIPLKAASCFPLPA